MTAARPTARVFSSTSSGYGELLEVVKAHGYDLIQQTAALLAPSQVAAHWYDCVFRPTLRTAEETGLSALLSSCQAADIFLCLHRSNRSAFGSECAAAEDAIQQAAEATRASFASRQPGLLRRIFPARRPVPPKPLLRRRP